MKNTKKYIYMDDFHKKRKTKVDSNMDYIAAFHIVHFICKNQV